MLPSLSRFQYPEGSGKVVFFFHSFYFLYNYYNNDLLQELADSGVGCHCDNLFVGALAYANNLTILATTLSV